MIDGRGISCEIALIWVSLDLNDEKSTLVQVMAWCRQATSHYLSQCWPRSLSAYGVTRPQWGIAGCLFGNLQRPNSLWPSDTIWRHRSMSTLAQVMACCLTTKPSPDTWTNVDLSPATSHGIQEISGPILGLRPANERRRYCVTTSLIGWAQAQNQPWIWWYQSVKQDWILHFQKPI